MDRKTIFDEVRRLLGRGFRPAEISALDAAISRASLPEGEPLPCPTSIGDAGIVLIKHFEGCAKVRPDGMVEAYPDPASGSAPFTIGWGATGADIAPGTIWTMAECDRRLETDLRKYSDDVRSVLGDAATTQNQFDAMVSFHYNTGAIRRATLTRLHRAGNFSGAAKEFGRWNKAAGRVMAGLVRRRAAEAALYCQS